MGQTKTPLIRSMMLGSSYGLCAILLNSFLTISIDGNTNYHFGETLVVLCLINRGVFPALVASLLSSLSLYVAFGNPFFFFTLGVEVLILGLLQKRHCFVLLGDMIYWLFLGMPLTYVLIGLFSDGFSGDSILITLKQAINGLLYVSLASALAPFMPRSWKTKKTSELPPKLEAKIFEHLAITATIAALSMGLVFVKISLESNLEQLNTALNRKATQTNAFISSYIKSHVNSVAILAESITHNPSIIDKPTQSLERVQIRNTGFITMLLADESGHVFAGAPASFYARMQKQPIEKRNVSDRDYFSSPQKNKKSFVSQAFQGRGFGNDIIVAISSPFYFDGQFEGIVEGSLNLPNFATIEQDMDPLLGESLILLDQHERIIYASIDLKKEAFEQFEYQVVKRNIPILRLENDGKIGEYFYTKRETINNWKIVVLKNKTVTSTTVKKYYFSLVIAFLFIALLSLLFSRFLSRFLTKPLESIVRDLSSTSSAKLDSDDLEYTVETLRVKHRLEQAKEVFLDFQAKLKNQVDKRTQELSKANLALEKLVREDALTGLYNRRCFDEIFNQELKKASRLKMALSLALVDIDHFKNINDSWGHPVGDKFIQHVARILSLKLQRDTDVIARVGGEEFALLFHTDTANQSQRILESVLKSVAESPLSVEAEEIFCTISIGAVYLIPKSSDEAPPLYSRADQLLYNSKEKGRNQLTFNHVDSS